MIYSTGETVQIGDTVLIESGKTKGVVHAIIETLDEAKEWSVEEPGLSIKSEPFGLVFWPQSETEDPVQFVSRRVQN